MHFLMVVGICEDHFDDLRVPLVTDWLTSTPVRERSRAVSYFFHKLKLNVQVTASEIPYRDW
jgi:hypothetical protein